MFDKSFSHYHTTRTFKRSAIIPVSLTYPFAELYCANNTNFHSLISIRRRINRSRYLHACRAKNVILEKSADRVRAIIRAENLIST